MFCTLSSLLIYSDSYDDTKIVLKKPENTRKTLSWVIPMLKRQNSNLSVNWLQQIRSWFSSVHIWKRYADPVLCRMCVLRGLTGTIHCNHISGNSWCWTFSPSLLSLWEVNGVYSLRFSLFKRGSFVLLVWKNRETSKTQLAASLEKPCWSRPNCILWLWRNSVHSLDLFSSC